MAHVATDQPVRTFRVPTVRRWPSNPGIAGRRERRGLAQTWPATPVAAARSLESKNVDRPAGTTDGLVPRQPVEILVRADAEPL